MGYGSHLSLRWDDICGHQPSSASSLLHEETRPYPVCPGAVVRKQDRLRGKLTGSAGRILP